ncbi:hypothetical protein SAMN06295912_1076 [Sphingomonas laterariae]|uniref:Outer membrane protein beta-barrel domain-containing protein n=1 Tax=Edaphosphingomonas laterariae TaxID=861865 RepID=A0A239ELN4_9SPHN|nr:hypothetical protein [Sphingomonas laterariae]SNS45690.1 hypothetical protein SAMN06295912_1076 [Sphingomonas laterariae]
MQLPAIAQCRSISRRGTMAAATLGLAIAAPAEAQKEKAAEDPTKIATKAGVSYSDELSVSGSVAFGAKFKVNGRVSESGQWSIGASYLFPVAILTFSAARIELDSGVEQTRYSLGGFVPLTELGLDTGKWRLFVPFGYSHTNGKQPSIDIDQNEGFPTEMSSSSGYVGLFSIRPLNEHITLLAGGNVTNGTNDFSGYSVGGGLSYHLSGRDTVGLSGNYIDNSFGQRKRVSVSYRHEF